MKIINKKTKNHFKNNSIRNQGEGLFNPLKLY